MAENNPSLLFRSFCQSEGQGGSAGFSAPVSCRQIQGVGRSGSPWKVLGRSREDPPSGVRPTVVTTHFLAVEGLRSLFPCCVPTCISWLLTPFTSQASDGGRVALFRTLHLPFCRLSLLPDSAACPSATKGPWDYVAHPGNPSNLPAAESVYLNSTCKSLPSST